jgi:hypothetical protein
MGAGFIGKLDSALEEMDRFREEGKHQRVAKPAHRWFVFGGLLLMMTSIFIRCLPLRPVVAVLAFVFAMPRAEAGLVEDGVAALNAGETTAARQFFSEAAGEASGDRAASLHLAAGSAASKARDWSAAVDSFSSALSAEDPEIQQQAHYALATSLFYFGVPKAKAEKVKAWKGAIEHFEASLELQPEHQASSDNLQSVRKQLAELQKEGEQDEPEGQDQEEKGDQEDNEKEEEGDQEPKEPDQSDDDGKDDESKKKDPEEEGKNPDQNNPNSEENPDDQADKNKGEENKGDPSNEDKDDKQGGDSNEDESQQDPKSGDDQSDPKNNQNNGQEGKQDRENKSEPESANLKDDPDAPENETPRERARRLLKQYSDFGGKAPRRIQRSYNRSQHDW